MPALGLPSRLSSRSRVSFFLCDVQAKVAPYIYEYKPLIGATQTLIKAARILNVPLIATGASRPLDVAFYLVRHPEHPGKSQNPANIGRIDPVLDVSFASFFKKSKFSMPTPEVWHKFIELRIDHVVLFGIESHICVLQTALALRERGIGVTVVKDAVSSMDRGEISVALATMERAGVFISTSESVFFQIMSDAEHPAVKEIQKLLKETKESKIIALNAFCDLDVM
ncbi:Isochorismatase domain-containing protein 1 [Entophlyctis sp. JEL0112]|nr:Isochorismatase domain-containing protein 1 [Entophlyctis sp. JEL0112]